MLLCDCMNVVVVPLDKFHKAMREVVSVNITCDSCHAIHIVTPPWSPPVAQMPPLQTVSLP
jgi:hypothetical protein